MGSGTRINIGGFCYGGERGIVALVGETEAMGWPALVCLLFSIRILICANRRILCGLQMASNSPNLVAK
jgi:hypothetical protein